MHRHAFCLALTFQLASCTNGPALIANSHVDYNRAVRQVMNEELLLNIVRMRYAEAPQFVEVSGITTSFSTKTGVGVDGSAITSSGSSLGVNGVLEFTDNPAITMTPRQGRETATQLLGSISVSDIPYLTGAGYRLDHLLVLLAENINGVRSFDIGGELPTRGGDQEFIDAIHAVGELQLRDEIICGFLKAYDYYDGAVAKAQLNPTDYLAAIQSGKRWRPVDGQEDAWALHTYALEPVIWISPEGLASEEGKLLVRVLRLDPDAPFYWLGDLKFQTPPTEPSDSFRIRMRSFYGVMNLLAHAVEVPPEDKAQGRAILDRPEKEGMAKHLFRYLGRILHIHESHSAPKNAFVAVKHRDTWFYIDDREVMSKRAFTLAIELMNLEISGGPTTSPSPILTIPIG